MLSISKIFWFVKGIEISGLVQCFHFGSDVHFSFQWSLSEGLKSFIFLFL